jgi:Domain of unknown function (DUF4145)
MAVHYHLNKTEGREFDLPCPKCAGATTHKALATVDLRGSEGGGNHSYQWSVDHQIVQCQGCKSVSFRVASSNSEDYYHTDDGDTEYEISEDLYPPRLSGRKGLGDDTTWLPVKVRQIYDETLKALFMQARILSGIGLRALVEAVCQHQNAQGRDLFKQIDSLVEQRVLTPAGALILHKIRALGNAAAHEAKPHSEKQLSLAMDIVEHLLKDVYILPRQTDLEFEGEKPEDPHDKTD